MSGAYKYRPQYTQNTIGPSGSIESYPGQHLELRRKKAAQDLLERLNSGPMMLLGEKDEERNMCAEEALKIITEGLAQYDEEKK